MGYRQIAPCFMRSSVKATVTFRLLCVASILAGCSRAHVTVGVQPETVKLLHPQKPHPWTVGYPFTLWIYRLEDAEYSTIHDEMKVAQSYPKQMKLCSMLFAHTKKVQKPFNSVQIQAPTTELFLAPGHYLVHSLPNFYSKGDGGWAVWDIGNETTQVPAIEWLSQASQGDE